MVEWYLSLNPTVNPLPFHLIPRDQLGSALDLRRGAHDPPFLAFLRLQICDQGAISQQMFSFPTPASAAEKSGEKQPKVLKAQMFGTVSCSKLRTVGPAKRPPPPGRPAPHPPPLTVPLLVRHDCHWWNQILCKLQEPSEGHRTFNGMLNVSQTSQLRICICICKSGLRSILLAR